MKNNPLISLIPPVIFKYEHISDAIHLLAKTISANYANSIVAILELDRTYTQHLYSDLSIGEELCETLAKCAKEKYLEIDSNFNNIDIQQNFCFDSSNKSIVKYSLKEHIPIVENNNIIGLLTIFLDSDNSLEAKEDFEFFTKYLTNIFISFDITYRRLVQDPLTGLYRRGHLQSFLEKSFAQAKHNNTSLGLIMLDIDHFKNINDSYGHQSGDLIIQELGNLIRSITKSTDIMGRYGGDEFTIISPNTSEIGIKALAERLLDVVRRHIFKKHGYPLNFTISIGYTSNETTQATEAMELLDVADKALYIAKKSGRNQACCAEKVLKSQKEKVSERMPRSKIKSKGNILVVDDEEPMLKLMTRILERCNYNVRATTNAEEILKWISEDTESVDVLISDINMPIMNGLKLIQAVRDINPNIVTIIVSGFTNTENTIEALRAGAYNVVQKPFDIKEIELIVDRGVERRKINKQLESYKTHIQELLKEKTHELHNALTTIEYSFEKTMEAIIGIQDIHETNTAHHSIRVSKYATFLAKKMNITDCELLKTIQYGALLHDIGKMGISDNILLKPGKLTEGEMAIMQTHSVLGYDVIKGIPLLKEAAELVHQHHERYDGFGYPNALKKNEICIGARIFSVIDTLDAIINNRCYREGSSLEKAIEEINKHSGTQFDPDIVTVLNSCYKELVKII